MELSTTAVTLSPEQVAELNKRLADLRHDINNHLSLIVAAAELIKISANSVPRMSATLAEQPTKIAAELNKFSALFEQMVGVARS
jgi:hypothetical protein